MSPDSLNFTFVDDEGNSLQFGGFRRQFPTATEYWDVNWLLCKITMNARITVSVEGFLLTSELRELAKTIRETLASNPSENTIDFEPLEPYVNLRFTRDERGVKMLARLDLEPALGPVVEFCFMCQPAEMENTLRSIEAVAEAFPVRGKPDA